MLGGCMGALENDAPVAHFAFEASAPRGSTWFKGTTHTHTSAGGGDSSADEVVEWYRAHGYDFVMLSDGWHAGQSSEDFLAIPGPELRTSFQEAPIHISGLGAPSLPAGQPDSSLAATLQRAVHTVSEAGGVPQINHPSLGWAFGFEELIQVDGYRLLEIWSDHPEVHNLGALSVASLERTWDQLLSSGRRIFGVAVDDATHFQGSFDSDGALPGGAWIAVRAPSLTAEDILWALENGHFYASTGPEIEDIVVRENRYELRIRPAGDERYVTYFIAEQGTILAAVEGTEPRFEINQPTQYVRARVQDTHGRVAWTQPAFVSIREGAAPVDSIRFLALGDSYTIGEGVDPAVAWPSWLARWLRNTGRIVSEPVVVARTGWTTEELIEGIEEAAPEGPFDLVSVLVGVNDQYRGGTPEEFEVGFRAILERAIEFSGRGVERVFVLSIPDWGATPFAEGRDRGAIAESIDAFNARAQSIAEESGARWIDVTELSRRVADDPTLATSDRLHLDGRMYEMWVTRLAPTVEAMLAEPQ